MINKHLKQLFVSLYLKEKDNGFTSIEFIILTLIIGTISSLVVPQIEPVVNRYRQKEATGIVNSMIKAAQSNYALSAYLPDNSKDISKFASLQKCNADNVQSEGASACRKSTPVNVDDELFFYSPSGRYEVEMRKFSTEDGQQIFQVKANPNGKNFSKKGSAVVGCYNPSTGITDVKEYSSKIGDKGVQPYLDCGFGSDKDKDFCELNPTAPECDFCRKNPKDPQCDEKDFCELNPSHQSCKELSKPDDPVERSEELMGEDFCKLNPTNPKCIEEESNIDSYIKQSSLESEKVSSSESILSEDQKTGSSSFKELGIEGTSDTGSGLEPDIEEEGSPVPPWIK